MCIRDSTKIGDFASSTSVKCLLDILYGCILSLNYKKNLDEKINIAKEIDAVSYTHLDVYKRQDICCWSD